MSTLDALIIGGGISGLSTAAWLGNAGAKIETWESSVRPGGKIQTEQAEGYRMEHAATMLVESNDYTSRFLQQSDMNAFRVARNPSAKRYLVDQGQLVGLSQKPSELFRSPLWSRRGRMRMLLEPFVPRANNAEETVQEFVTRRFGREIYVKAMEPYMSGPLASDGERACARSVLPQLTAMEKRFGSVAGGLIWNRLRGRRVACRAQSVIFRGGMRTLTDSLAANPLLGFRRELRVKELVRVNGTWRVRAESAGREVSVSARHIVLSVPALEAARLVTHVDHELDRLLSGIEYAPLSVVHVAFDRSQITHSLDGAGFLVPGRERMPLNGVLWMSSLVPDCAPEGMVMMTAYVGGARHPQAADWSDRQTADAVLETLDRLLGVSGVPTQLRIIRHKQALPQYFGNYHARVQAIGRQCLRHDNLHICANYIGGVAIRNRIEQGYHCATQILEQLEQHSGTRLMPNLSDISAASGA